MNTTMVKEDIEVGIDSHTEEINLTLNISRSNRDVSTDFDVSLDEQTKQIVITPKNPQVFFTLDDTKDTVEVNITTNMISENNDFGYDVNVDQIGQAIISPKDSTTEFISVAVKDDLNLITDEDTSYTDDKCVEVLKELTNDFTLEEGTITTFYEDEKTSAVNLLKTKYANVSVDCSTTDSGHRWAIKFDTISEPTVDDELTEDTHIGDEDGDVWKVTYEFNDDALTEGAEGDAQTVTITAADAETALKYAKQYTILQRREDPKWGDASVVELKKENA